MIHVPTTGTAALLKIKHLQDQSELRIQHDVHVYVAEAKTEPDYQVIMENICPGMERVMERSRTIKYCRIPGQAW